MSFEDSIIAGVDILRTTVDPKTKRVTAQTGSVIAKTVASENAEWWQHVGIKSLPPEPVGGKTAAQAIGFCQGGHDILFASCDERGLELAGELKPGETCVYAAGKDGKGQARALFKQNGSVTLFTRKGNVAGGMSLQVQLDAENGAVRAFNDLGFALIIDANGIVLSAKDASLTLSASGNISLVGKGKVQIDGSGIMLGAVGVPGVNSALVGPTGLVGVASAKVLIALASMLLIIGALVRGA